MVYQNIRISSKALLFYLNKSDVLVNILAHLLDERIFTPSPMYLSFLGVFLYPPVGGV